MFKLTKRSQTLASDALVLTIGGTVLKAVHSASLRALNLAKKELTTEITFTSQNRSFHDLLSWLSKNIPMDSFRTLKVRNGRYGDDDSLLSLGNGRHFFWFDGTPIFVQLSEQKKPGYYELEELTLTIPGRDHSLFERLMAHIKTCENKENTIDTYRFSDGSWSYVRAVTKRRMDSVFIEEHKRQELLAALDDFRQREAWYKDHGIPYSLGIMLYGPPGTGKTSLIKVLAGYLGMDVYYISPSELYKLPNAMARLPNNVVVVVEDIDSSSMVRSRVKKAKKKPKIESIATSRKPPKNKPASDDLEEVEESASSVVIGLPDSSDNMDVEDFLGFGLSDILNSLDGFFSPHGRILIATTNHIEKIDDAVLRPGRFDVTLEIGYVGSEVFEKFITSFYPDYPKAELRRLLSKCRIQPELTVAELQKRVRLKQSADQIITDVLIPG
jgi:chaperone BCS1